MLEMLGTILKNGFSKPSTRLYPGTLREQFPQVRGRLEIEIEHCIFCNLCAKKCPANCLKVDRTEQKWELDPFSCVICGVCVEVCPKQCLALNQLWRKPSQFKQKDLFTKNIDHIIE